MTPIYFWRYTLTSRSTLNSVSKRREFEGALIRIGNGFGNLHPWSELGDKPLAEQLRTLQEGGETPLIRGAKECVRYDAAMREAGTVIDPHTIPESHWLVTEGDDPFEVKEEGFRIAKLKGTPSFENTSASMLPWIEAGFRIRLDFNESLASGDFFGFWDRLSPREIEAIELVEDPEIYSRSGWLALRGRGVPVAVDRDAEKRLEPQDIQVMKPARADILRSDASRFFVTSYMDHAVGQMWAAHKAAMLYPDGIDDQHLTCGLLTHRCFEGDSFFDEIQTQGPALIPPPGLGLGFDDLLEKLPWKRLN